MSAVTLPFVLSRGLTQAEFFSIQAIFFAVLAAAEIPTGIVGDLLDRKSVLVLASIVRGLGGTLLIFSYDFELFLVSFLLIAVGNSFFSGIDLAVLYESNEARGTSKESSVSLLGTRFMFMQVGTAVSTVAGAAIATYSLEIAIVANCIGAWIPLWFSLKLMRGEARHESMVTRGKNLYRALLQPSLRTPRLLFLLATICIYSAAPFAAFYVFQALWEEFDLPLYAYGIIAAVYGVFGAFAARVAHWGEQRVGAYGVMAAIGGLPVLAFMAGASSYLFLALLCGVLLELCRGLTQTVLVARFNELLSEETRATANSVVSLGTRMTAAGMSAVLAALFAEYSVSPVMLFAAAFYGVIILAVFVTVLAYPSTLAMSSPSVETAKDG
jgi:MFS family permease